ncbi:MAG: PrsW family glutamic-type intramembrane protease [Bacteroidales bacterium]|nr:PrsW family glutamic-type intramembrane protease [Bacteroidales bacterium]
MSLIVSLLPVVLFLVFLIYIDSFKLVSVRTIVVCFFYGMLTTVVAYFINTWLCGFLGMEFTPYSRLISPVVEELLKAGLVLLLVMRRKVGFMIDAAIYGFAVGTGFAVAENIYYIMTAENTGVILWMVRGFGTALMHGGGTTLFAVLMLSAISRGYPSSRGFFWGILPAVVLHSVYNHFLVSPVISTLFIFVSFPLLVMLMFKHSESKLQQWLEIEFDTEVQLLNKMRQGGFLATKAGAYLVSVKDRFSSEVVLDMYCFIRLYLELSIKAKRNLMLRENGFPAIIEPDTVNQLKELEALKKQIGKTGWIALSPLIRMDYRDLWKLNQLKEQPR